MASAWLLTIIFLISSSNGLRIMNFSRPSLSINIDVDKEIIIQNPTINFMYNRDTVRIYNYPGTPSVNVLVDNSAISIKGQVENYNTGFDVNNEKFFITEIIGIANIANTSNFEEGLKDCKFFISDKYSKRSSNALTHKLDAKIFKYVEAYVTLNFCRELGPIKYEDFARARMTRYDFGRKSVSSPYVLLAYPNIIAPKTAEDIWFRNEANTEKAADFILRQASQVFHETNAGIIPIADFRDQIFTASEGKFSGIDNLQRVSTMKVPMSNMIDGEKSFNFTLTVPKGHVQYQNYQAFQFIPLGSSLCADVQDLMFTATVVMDFKGKYCKAKLLDLKLFNPGYSHSYVCNQSSFLANPIIQSFIKAWSEETIESIRNQIIRVLAISIPDSFDCEAFRSSFK
ncbi:hypothetical protein QAD02_014732 [Eretmocerus hayati]|uniref:Uncharacterized protein n=1 Tax=Eretmocerus hayati TaxID=131215 RepID=A0ACC2PB05_9HYME|nr:hypothetical protein QAD02_014732 [Eretmocerus hayati]